MNEFEKEVARSQLNAERHTLDELKEIYRQAIEEVCERIEISDGKIKTLLSEIDKSDPQMISVLQSQIYQKKFQQSIKNQLDFLLKDLNDRQYTSISEYLSNSYDNGFIGTLYSLNMNDIPVNIPIDPALVVRAIHIESKLSKSLYEELGEDVELLKRRVFSTISRGIASNMHYSDIARNIANNSRTGLNRAMTITRTEGNRIYNTANLHSGKQAKAKTGADLIKQWDSTLDGVTRPHHRQLDGQVRELDEPFEIGNRKALTPLQFGIPGEDVNCRCIALIKPRWDIDETFTKIDNQTGQLLEFQGVEDYEDFKKRYWETVDKSQESGIIKEKSKKPITKITDSSIERVPNVKINGYTQEQCDFIQKQHKELLEYSRDKNENKEVAFVFDSNLQNRKEFTGSDDKLDFGSSLYGKDLIVMHNHPRNSSYSITDLIFFRNSTNIKTLTIVKNNGNTEYITKNQEFDYDKFKLEYDRLYKKLVPTGTDKEKDKFVRTFLNKTKSGVIWSERKE